MFYKVKQVAEWAHVSVRTLHHYDEIGLVTPQEYTESGHRLYTELDIERLQQVLFFREIGFSLQEIKSIVDQPNFDRKQALEAHKELLIEKKKRLEKIIATVQKTLDGGITISNKNKFDGFDMQEIEEFKSKYADEVRQKYGETIVNESQKRTNSYTKEDWQQLSQRNDAINKKIIGAMDKGPADPIVQEGVAEFRQYITDTFYECTPEIFRGLADLYVEDARFTKNLDKNTPGFAAFLREAMIIYCDNLVK